MAARTNAEKEEILKVLVDVRWRTAPGGSRSSRRARIGPIAAIRDHCPGLAISSGPSSASFVEGENFVPQMFDTP
jgi:hypothetical protein